jgi:hypothetical protein
VRYFGLINFLIFFEIGEVFPRGEIGSAGGIGNHQQLFDFGFSGGHGFPGVQFHEYTTGTPHVDAGPIVNGTDEYFWRSIPERDDLVRQISIGIQSVHIEYGRFE